MGCIHRLRSVVLFDSVYAELCVFQPVALSFTCEHVFFPRGNDNTMNIQCSSFYSCVEAGNVDIPP